MPAPGGMIGLFPVVTDAGTGWWPAQRQPLDFRLVVDVTGDAADRQVTSTTLVRTNNLLGRTYLTLIMPFHNWWCAA